jgi:drug/metabolite transporter (DMT)-like permease
MGCSPDAAVRRLGDNLAVRPGELYMSESNQSPGGLTLATFGLAVTLGSANFLAVRISNRELPPFWGAGLRFGLAAFLFIAIALALRLSWPRGRRLVLTGVYGLLSFALSYALMYWALVRVTAGMATVVLALVPLLTPLLAALERLERLQRRAVGGAVVALAGILWMTVGSDGIVLPVDGLVAMLAAAVTIAQSVILGKLVAHNHPAMTNAVAMAVGASVLLGISAAAGETWTFPEQTQVIWSVAYLVTLGSVGLFVLVLLVVRRWTASATAYMFVLFPVATMLLEAWLVDEPLTARGVVGALAVMAGVWFGALAPSAGRRTAFPSREEAAAETP